MPFFFCIDLIVFNNPVCLSFTWSWISNQNGFVQNQKPLWRAGSCRCQKEIKEFPYNPVLRSTWSTGSAASLHTGLSVWTPVLYLPPSLLFISPPCALHMCSAGKKEVRASLEIYFCSLFISSSQRPPPGAAHYSSREHLRHKSIIYPLFERRERNRVIIWQLSSRVLASLNWQ